MELPLFPLHAVLCPGIVMPLHIFEDRYRALTRHCIETGSPFGIVLIREGLEMGASPSLAVAGVGAVAEIREVSRYADGRYEIEEPDSRAGDYLDLRADMDLFVAISNCPQENNPCNGFNPTALQIVVYDRAS